MLEHPADSKLWATCGLPLPGYPTDEYGGRTYEVQQVEWGHVTRKRTWLYCVRTGPIPHPPFPERAPTHSVCNGRGMVGGKKRATALQARLTPPAFAEMLVALARSVTSPP